ncbi:MAG: helix-turn-helix domain-containing protein [Bacteroidota bacterium]
MVLSFSDTKTGGLIKLHNAQSDFGQKFLPDQKDTTLTIAWNRAGDQKVTVDDEVINFPSCSVIVLNVSQSFKFEKPENITAWQFNREFYCIVDHDHEVSCVGLLFYGNKDIPVVYLSDEDSRKLDLLFQVFIDEFGEDDDNLKSEMLRVILKRLIVKLTRSYKVQNDISQINNKDLDVVRQFNLLVEKNYRKLHQVQDYADLLYKSPKTISNLFSKYSQQSPLEVIHERILLEAKRLLIYTDKTTKEIAYDTGFPEIPSFSRFFKKHMAIAPSQYRDQHRNKLIGKN